MQSIAQIIYASVLPGNLTMICRRAITGHGPSVSLGFICLEWHSNKGAPWTNRGPITPISANTAASPRVRRSSVTPRGVDEPPHIQILRLRITPAAATYVIVPPTIFVDTRLGR
jgi:hypothetical protein